LFRMTNWIPAPHFREDKLRGNDRINKKNACHAELTRSVILNSIQDLLTCFGI